MTACKNTYILFPLRNIYFLKKEKNPAAKTFTVISLLYYSTYLAFVFLNNVKCFIDQWLKTIINTFKINAHTNTV